MMTRAKATPLVAGTRVQVRGTPSGLTLVVPTGTVVGPDPDWDGYYIVRLDEPARYYCRGADEPLDEITEAADNLERLAPHD